MEMKYCSNPNCKQKNPQPIENFHKDTRKKDGLRSRCKACELERAAQYRETHKKERAAKQRKYYVEHGEIQRKASRNWKANNRERNKEITDNWYQTHKAERSKYNREYGQANHDGVLERSRKKRAKSYGLNEHFTESEFTEKFNALGRKCYYCGKILTEENVTRDHYIPLVKGGTDDIDNIVPCCQHCNSTKRNQMPDEFIELLGNHEPSRTNGDM